MPDTANGWNDPFDALSVLNEKIHKLIEILGGIEKYNELVDEELSGKVSEKNDFFLPIPIYLYISTCLFIYYFKDLKFQTIYINNIAKNYIQL